MKCSAHKCLICRDFRVGNRTNSRAQQLATLAFSLARMRSRNLYGNPKIAGDFPGNVRAQKCNLRYRGAVLELGDNKKIRSGPNLRFNNQQQKRNSQCKHSKHLLAGSDSENWNTSKTVSERFFVRYAPRMETARKNLLWPIGRRWRTSPKMRTSISSRRNCPK